MGVWSTKVGVASKFSLITSKHPPLLNPGYATAVEPYKAGKQPRMHSRAIQSKQTPISKIFLNNAHHGYSPFFMGGKHCKCMASLYKHMGKVQRAITLILRHESKFPKVKSLVSTHSACPCKKYLPRCSQFPHELLYFVFFLFSV